MEGREGIGRPERRIRRPLGARDRPNGFWDHRVDLRGRVCRRVDGRRQPGVSDEYSHKLRLYRLDETLKSSPEVAR